MLGCGTAVAKRQAATIGTCLALQKRGGEEGLPGNALHASCALPAAASAATSPPDKQTAGAPLPQASSAVPHTCSQPPPSSSAPPAAHLHGPRLTQPLPPRPALVTHAIHLEKQRLAVSLHGTCMGIENVTARCGGWTLWSVDAHAWVTIIFAVSLVWS